uniref:Cysteine--tRNA ligase, cytoplasmic n=1 Tax=Cupiennius salei TaxID=6928 RepID=T1E1M8_CUPSA
MKRTQPSWNSPTESPNAKLKLYNSFTKEKEFFIPQFGNKVLWYSCGPTVYDAAHMGHARSYISFDILRRVLADYFGYDVFYVMNITDIDDKIIKRARQNYLFDQFKENGNNIGDVILETKKALKHYETLLKAAEEKEKKDMYQKIIDSTTEAVKNLENSSKSDSSTTEGLDLLFSKSKDVLSEWLDLQKGSEVNDNSIFSELPARYEKEFFEDMKNLNVQDPDVVTRVSEYIEEIIQYIEKIIENGLAYESNGSVYFDTIKFDESPGHFYGKLVPEAFGDLKKLQEGEGDLSISSDRLKEKRNPSDFALWKTSKPGEPSWNSPWGKGRPGWHIECSVMASDVLGDSLDIHTGGYDLKFPHHDNELAQAEAYFDNDHWVRYFLHSGHLTISGCKMSKSLKNFITIKEALDYHTARQIRLAFLLHSWKDTLDYSPETLDIALHYERVVREFKHNVKDILRNSSASGEKSFTKQSPEGKALNKMFLDKRKGVHEALCDNVDTRSALDYIHELIRNANKYMSKNKGSQIERKLLEEILSYVMKMLKIFGADFSEEKSTSQDKNSNFENDLMPYLRVLADFREDIRILAKKSKAFDILKICDDLRDNGLQELGVRLEDREGQKAVIKYVDPAVLAEERVKLQKLEEMRKIEKQKQIERLKAEKAEKEALKSIPPGELFKRLMSDKYSQFDDKGIPTHDSEGKALTESQMKKVKKMFSAQEKKYNTYLQTVKAS